MRVLPHRQLVPHSAAEPASSGARFPVLLDLPCRREVLVSLAPLVRGRVDNGEDCRLECGGQFSPGSDYE